MYEPNFEQEIFDILNPEIFAITQKIAREIRKARWDSSQLIASVIASAASTIANNLAPNEDVAHEILDQANAIAKLPPQLRIWRGDDGSFVPNGGLNG